MSIKAAGTHAGTRSHLDTREDGGETLGRGALRRRAVGNPAAGGELTPPWICRRQDWVETGYAPRTHRPVARAHSGLQCRLRSGRQARRPSGNRTTRVDLRGECVDGGRPSARRTKTTFVRVHGAELSAQALHEAEKLNDDPVARGLKAPIETAIKLSSDIGSAIDDMRVSPQDRQRAREDQAKLHHWR